MMLPNIATIRLDASFKRWRQGRTGEISDRSRTSSILADFALEAKCYSVSSSVGVREMSRLISRLRHRQFGILVTTSYVDLQAYKEIKEDLHPIMVVAGADIGELLKANGLGSAEMVKLWLASEFRID